MTDETEKVPADAPGYQLGGPVPKTRVQLLAEQELASENSDERKAIDAAKAEIQNAPTPDPLA